MNPDPNLLVKIPDPDRVERFGSDPNLLLKIPDPDPAKV
jgi:hypothetical protein